MDKNIEKILAKFGLIQNELEKFQAQSRRENVSCVQKDNDGDCAASILAKKLISIFQDEAAGGLKLGSESPSFSFQTQTSPEQKAMSNSVVVRTILSWMSPQFLFKLRKVSKLWMEEATSILLCPRTESRPGSQQRELFSVEFIKSEHFANFNHNNGTLPQFMNECLQHSTIFPCSHFVFNGGRLNDPNLILFFFKYGGHVQHLDLNPEVVDLSTLEQILKWTPNLKSLIFQPISWAEGRHLVEEGGGNTLQLIMELESESESAQPHHLFLPNLKTIALPKTKSTNVPPGGDIIYEILTCAPNLTSIEDPQLSYVHQIVAAVKLSLIKSLRWDFFYNDALVQNFHRFVQAGPQLKSVFLEHVTCVKHPAALKAAIKSIFHLGQNTLENITEIQLLGGPHGPSTLPAVMTQFPILPKVTHLQVEANRSAVFRILPEGQSLDLIFPNLKSMHLTLGVALTQNPSPLCAHSLLEKLTISKVTYEFNYTWVEPIRLLYPNISQLQLVMSGRGLEDICEGLRKIPQRFEQLEQLHFEISVDCDLPDQFKSKMDQALTGLPWDIFERLWSSQSRSTEPDPEFQKLEVLDQVRMAPSILDLKKLRSLTFEVRFKLGAKPLWSHMAQFYAFQPMSKRQGLEVKVRGFQSKDIPLNRSDLGPI